jgi:hypothetical protein
MQQEGLEAARNFWSLHPEKSKLFDISHMMRQSRKM